MSTLLFANNAGSTLAGPINNTATTINLAAGGGALFPNPSAGQIFKITLTDAATGLIQEICHCTTRVGDQLTVVRGQEGTTPQNWTTGDLVENLVTAGTLAEFAQAGTGAASTFYGGTDTGVDPNALTVPTVTPANTNPQPGQIFLITKNNLNNTSNVTLSVGGSASKSVVYKDGSQLNASDWPGSAAAWVYYTGAVYQFLACAGNVPAISLIHEGADAGAANALSCTVAPPIASYVNGMVFSIIPAADNTGATTANFGAGVRSVVKANGAALTGGEIKANQPILVVASGTQLLLIGAVKPSDYPADPITAASASAALGLTRPASAAEIAAGVPSGSSAFQQPYVRLQDFVAKPSFGTPVGAQMMVGIVVGSAITLTTAGFTLGGSYPGSQISSGSFTGMNANVIGVFTVNGAPTGILAGVWPNGAGTFQGTFTGTWQLVGWLPSATNGTNQWYYHAIFQRTA